MGSYAILDNRNNAVLEIVEWDGVSDAPERAIDTTLHELPAGVTPTVGQLWNGTNFVDPPAATEPEPPADEYQSRAAQRKAERKAARDDANE